MTKFNTNVKTKQLITIIIVIIDMTLITIKSVNNLNIDMDPNLTVIINVNNSIFNTNIDFVIRIIVITMSTMSTMIIVVISRIGVRVCVPTHWPKRSHRSWPKCLVLLRNCPESVQEGPPCILRHSETNIALRSAGAHAQSFAWR